MASAQPHGLSTPVYTHVPKLGPYQKGDHRYSLLPKLGGLPGAEYAQIPLAVIMRRRNDAAGHVTRRPDHDTPAVDYPAGSNGRYHW